MVIGCRNLAASQKVATELSCNVSGSVEAMKLDLYNPDSIRQFVDEFKQKHGKLKALINNAGVNFPNDTRHDPANDREVILHTNYVGPFLLTKLLLPTLEASAPSRIINLSSAAHEGFLVPSMPRMNFDDLEWRARKYNGVNAYSESKLMVTLHTEELARRYGDKNVVAVSVQPGFILSGSGLTRAFIGPVSKHMMVPISWCLGAVSVTDGIQTTLHCVLADNVVNGACTCLRATLACSHPADDATCSAPTLTACCLPGV